MASSRSIKAPSTPATMSNEFIVKFRPFDKVETNRTCSICFDEISFDIVAKTATMSKECCFDTVAGVDGALAA